MFDSDSIMSFSTKMPSVSNNLKKIYIGGSHLDQFTSEYYNENNVAFGLLFQQYTYHAVNNMYYLSIVNEWKYNMYKSDYKDKHDLGVYIPSLKRKSA